MSSTITWAEEDHPGWKYWVELEKEYNKCLLPHRWYLFKSGWDLCFEGTEDGMVQARLDQSTVDTVQEGEL